ncbi:hypothetical protein F9910_19360, partial [Mycobacterium tuberculosis]
TLNARDQPPAEVSDQRVSGLTGAVQTSICPLCFPNSLRWLGFGSSSLWISWVSTLLGSLLRWHPMLNY